MPVKIKGASESENCFESVHKKIYKTPLMFLVETYRGPYILMWFEIRIFPRIVPAVKFLQGNVDN